MPPDAKRSGPAATPDRSRKDSDLAAEAIATVAQILALSDERDRWLARLLAAERAAYRRGFNDGRATACVALAEMEERYQETAWWREYAAKVRRIIQAETDPSARMRQVMAEIAADQRFARDARRKLATKPWELTPTESCVLRRIRFADPGDAAQWDAE